MPPVTPWFTCIHELEHKPYDKTKTQQCLDSILSHPEIEKGRFSRSKKVVTLSLESPTLVVTDLDLDVPHGELKRFHELFSANEAVNGDALHVRRLTRDGARPRCGLGWICSCARKV